MKILNLFNMAQDAYNITESMRNRGIEADLIITDQEYRGDVPSWESDETPDWVKVVHTFKKSGLREIKLLYILSKRLKDYDIIFCHGLSSMYPYLLGINNYIPYDAGLIRYLPIRKDSLLPYKRSKFTKLAYSILLRSYKSAPFILFTNPDTLPLFHDWHSKLKFVPFAINTERYKSMPKQGWFDKNIVFFMPSRHHWKEKGNDKAILAFARFNKNNPNSLLILIKWGIDWDKSNELIELLGIEKKVIIKFPMSKLKLIQLYNEADVILDQFNLGSWGTATPEAMSCEKPVIMYYEPLVINECFGSLPPLLNAQTEDEIFNRMEQFIDPEVRLKVGKESHEWVKKTHDPNLVVDVHMDIAEQLISKGKGR